jgi:hypothetical protein
MALTTAVVVGEAKNWIPEVAEKAAKLKLSAGIDFDFDFDMNLDSDLDSD